MPPHRSASRSGHRRGEGDAGRRGRLAELLTVGAVAVPVLAAFAPPVLAACGWHDAAEVCRAFFRKACHQDPARSFPLWGHPMGACARCAGVYAGLLAGAVLSFLPLPGAAPRGAVRRGLLVAMLLPVVLHPLAVAAGLAPDLALLRGATGLLAGAAAGRLLPQALAGAFVRRQCGSGGSPRDAHPASRSLVIEARTGRI